MSEKPKQLPWECQICGASIGYLGQWIQSALGCKLVAGCRGSSMQRALMSLPTRRWLAVVLSVAAFAVVTIILWPKG